MIALDLTPPAPITADQELANFDCGESSLNEWLKKRAFKNHVVGASRCFVLCAGTDVIGYYSLSAGAISHEAAPQGDAAQHAQSVASPAAGPARRR